jgi:deazaflavin-dependent oxidoreductase (nitroreductase family)
MPLVLLFPIQQQFIVHLLTYSPARMKFILIRLLSRIHTHIFQLSGGRIGNQLGKVRILLLTTVGSKSGQKRSVPLAAVTYGNYFIVVASFGGSPKNPSWFVNLRQNPLVIVQVGTKVHQADTWIVETTDKRYEVLWGLALKAFNGFETYRRKASRDIPLVIIKPHNANNCS